MKKRIELLTMMLFSLIILHGCYSSGLDNATDTPTGKGGSLARFTIVGNYMYAIDNQNLNIFDISDPNNVVLLNTQYLGFGIETVFPRGNALFVGSRTGMHIFNILDPANPVQISTFEHVYSCDPVVADDNYAYVTLRSNQSRCGRTENQLNIVDIRDLQFPSFVTAYPMTSPKGLGKKDDILFVCDDGLEVWDVTDVLNAQKVQQFNISANDVIPLDTSLLVIGNDGLYQYTYKNNDLSLISKISKK